jgi:tetratricopeptide (TPR) repeat protein
MSWRPVRTALIALALMAAARPAGAACVLDKVVEIPVVMEGLEPVMTAKVNGVDARLMVDSGAFFSSISRSRLAKFRLSSGPLPPNLEVRGVNGVADVGLTTAQDFNILGANFRHTQFLAGGIEFGPQADGILGRNFLMVADAELDLANGAIRLFSPKGCSGSALAYWAGATTPYSVINTDTPRYPTDRIVGTAKVNGQTIRAIFDSGAATSVLTLRAAGRAGIRPDGPGVVAVGITHGFGHRSIETWIAPVDSFKIGEEEIKNTRLQIGAIELEDADMLIGADFMLSHRIYVARSQNKLYFTYNGGPVFRLETSTAAPRPSDVAQAPPAPGAAPAGDEPKDAAGYARRGAAFAARREYDRAVADFSKAMELDPNDARYPFDRAGARLASREPLLAMSDLDLALKLKPDFTMALYERGQLKLRSRDQPGATADFDVAVKADPALRLEVARSYQAADFPELAIAQLDAWIEANPRDERLATALSDRCRQRMLLGRDLDKAQSDCERAVRLRPSTPQLMDSRGWVRLRLGQYLPAIADFDAVLKLEPKTVWSLYGRGLAELKAGKTQEGQADVKAAESLGPQMVARLKNKYGLAPDAAAKP